MTEEELRTKIQEGFAKMKPKIKEMTNIIMDAYQEGFNTCFELLTGQKFNFAPKTEPKFHKGDLVVLSISDGEKVVQIDSVEYFKSGEPKYITSEGKWFGNGTKAHLWTIADAKDGDVLFYRGNVKYSDGIKFDRILLFENLDKSFFVLTKYYNGAEDYGINENIDYPDNIIPATKGQKEILFMAMKEAGYEWDGEKKELRKIEQNPTQEIEPFEAEHGKYYYCIKDYFCGGRKQASKGDVIRALRGLPIMGLKDASKYFLPVNFIKCNTAWSEEDEERLQSCISSLQGKGLMGGVDTINTKWLKSIKQKIGG